VQSVRGGVARDPLACAEQNDHSAVVEYLTGRLHTKEAYIWADALCINQEIASEKASQVRLMARSYRTAQMVPVWLGQADKDTKYAIACLNKIAQSRNEIVQVGLTNIFSDLRVLQIVYGLYLRPWKRRIWVIQEVALAAHVHVMCGRDDISWKDLMMVTELFNTIPPPRFHRDLLTYGGDHTCTHQPAALGIVRSGFQLSNGKPNMCLFEVLSLSRSFEFADRRDRIFSLLIIAAEYPRPGFNVPEVDYEASIAHVYNLTMRRILDDRGSLAVLSWAPRVGCVSHISKKLPSWVPDFSTSRKGIPDLDSTCVCKEHSSSPQAHFNASGGLVCQLVPFLNAGASPILQMQVLWFDTVSTPGAAHPPDRVSSFASWLNTAAQLVPEYKTGEPLSKVIMYTLLSGRDHKLEHLDDQSPNMATLQVLWKDLVCFVLRALSQKGCADDYASAIRSLVSVETKDAGNWLPSEVAVESYQNGLEPGQPNPKNRVIEAADENRSVRMGVGHSTLHKNLFTTESGYIGLEKEGIEHGDRICIAPGSNVPFMVRRTMYNRSRLVGEAYIHGIMFGEVITEDAQLQII